jgi:flotillin
MQMEAQARGTQEVLTKQALGLAEIVGAAGGDASDALRLMLADKMEELMKVQVEANKNIKIDKVTVWDGASGEKTATAGFLSGLAKSLPPLHDLFDMAGMRLPSFLGQEKSAEDNVAAPPEILES